MTTLEARALRRILVALDASRSSLEALRAAAALAARMGAELECLFIEDVNLVRLGQLPVARQVTLTGGAAGPLEPLNLEAELRAMAARAREAVAAAAAPFRLSWSFRVARGQVSGELLTAAVGADLLVVGRAGYAVPRGRGPGRVARAAAARAPVSVLVLIGEIQLGRPVLAVFDGSPGSERALSLAARLEGAGAGSLTVLLAASTREAAGRLAEQAAQLLGGAAAPAGRWIGGGRLSDVVRAVQEPDALLVVGADSPTLGGEAGLERLLEEVACPVLLAR